MMPLRLLPAAVAIAALWACTPRPAPDARPGLRYDGHYCAMSADVVYLIRFFPDGRAVLINGTKDVLDRLPSYLTHDAVGDPAGGWYNVPLRAVGDSLFFTTHAEKGELDYSGAVVNDTLVRFTRHSHINGQVVTREYTFRPDASK